MTIDINARALALTALDRATPLLDEFGQLSETDADATRDAFRDAFAAGAKRLALRPGVFLLGTIPASEPISEHITYQQPAVILPEGFVRLDGRGAEVLLHDGRGFHASAFMSWAYPTTLSYLAAPVAAGATSVPLEPGEGANWQVGDTALWRFGSLPYDLPEPLDWGMARVIAVDGDTLTLDRPLPAPFDPASAANKPFTNPLGETWINKGFHRWPIFDDLEVTDLIGSGVPSDDEYWAEQFLSVVGGRRVRFDRCGARRVGIAFDLHYVEGATIADCWAEDAATFIPAAGRGINLAECRDVEIRNFRARGLRRYVNMEAHSEGRVSGGLFENTGHRSGASYGAQCTVFTATSRSMLTVRDFTVTGHGGYVLTSIDNGQVGYRGTVRFEGNLTLIHPEEPLGIEPSQIAGMLDYRIAGGRELWDFARPRRWQRRIYLRSGLNQTIRGPRGILSRMRVYASAGLTVGASGTVTGFYVGRESGFGPNRAADLVAGADAELTFVGGTNGGVLWTKRSEQLKLLVQTKAVPGLDTADAYIDIECDIAVDRLASAGIWLVDGDARNSGPGGGLREAYFPAYDLAPIGAGATAVIDFAIPAVSNNDLVESFDYAGNLGSLSIRHMETIGGAVRVIFENLTPATVDAVPSDIRILWRKSLTSG